MKAALAIVQRDMQSWPRRKWFYVRRMGFVVLGGLMVIWGLFTGLITQTSTMGLQIFQSLSQTVLFGTCILSGLVAGTAIVQEKSERTLGLLLITDITPGQHIVGRFLSSTAVMLITVLSAFPMFVLTASLGGVSPWQITGAFILILAASILGVALGLLAASVTGTERSFIATQLTILAAVFVLLPLGAWILLDYLKIPYGTFLDMISPFRVMAHLSRDTAILPAIRTLAFSVGTTVPCLWLARMALFRSLERGGSPSLLQRLRSCRAARRIGLTGSPGPIMGNPIRWRDLHFQCGAPRTELLRITFLFVPTVIGCTMIIMLCSGERDPKAHLTAYAWVIGITTLLVFGLLAAYRAARAFNSEKLARTNELLLTTDLSVHEIIGGKMSAVVMSSLPWLAFAVGSLVIAGFAVDSGADALPLILAQLIWIAGAVFSLVCLGMLLSMRFKTPAVFGIGFLFLIAWHWIAKSMLSMGVMFAMTWLATFSFAAFGKWGAMFSFVIMAGFSLALDVGFGLICLSILRSKFRDKLMKEL
jgi:ABC-type transport system involved in multi-copper enzyme maturation permease subunit